MKMRIGVKYVVILELVLLFVLIATLVNKKMNNKSEYVITSATDIKYVEFNVTYSALDKAYAYDIGSQSEEIKLNWIELLSYLGAKYGGDFSKYKENDINTLVKKLQSKEETIGTLTEDMKYYSYYYEAYEAVLGGLVGEYEIEVASEQNPTEKVWVKKYGLKGFAPIAKNFPYSDYDDFGVSRSYGYARNHLGHDMMSQVGTPVVSV